MVKKRKVYSRKKIKKIVNSIPLDSHRIAKLTALRESVFNGKITNYRDFLSAATHFSFGPSQAGYLWERYKNINILRKEFGNPSLQRKQFFIRKAKSLGIEADEATDLYRYLTEKKLVKTKKHKKN